MEITGLYTYKYSGTYYNLNALHRQVLNAPYIWCLDGVDVDDFHKYTSGEIADILEHVIDDFIENIEPEEYPLWFTLITNAEVRSRLDLEPIADAMTELHAWNVMKK